MRDWYRLIAVSVLYVAVFLLSHAALAQQGSGLSYARADNGVIAVLVERSSGQFRIEAAGGAPLLFRGEKGVTAYTNLHLWNNTYTTNLLHRPASPAGTVPFPALRIEERSDRVRMEGIVRKGSDSVRFTQDLVPSVDGDYAYVNIITTVENLSSHPVSAGVLLMLDIMIGGADTVDLTVDTDRITRERDWRNSAVPEKYEATATGSPFRIRGRLRSATADLPDRFIAGSWQFNGYIGTIAWDYTPSGLPIIDDAVAMRWDDEAIAPGESRTVRSDYGYIVFADVELLCSIDAVGYNTDSTSYRPDPVSLRATVRNTGVLSIPSVDVTVTLPAELTLAAGETAMKTLIGPLAPGTSGALTWFAHPAAVPVPTRVQAQFVITSPPEYARSCEAETEIPPLIKPTAALDCGDTIRLTVHPNGGGYAPDPFVISAVVRNTGSVPLRGAVATLSPPAELVLLAPGASQAVLPDPLAPGQSAQVDWQMRAITQNLPTTAVYTVQVNSTDGIVLDCANAVLLPPINPEPCFEPGISTAGTEFHLAFLPDVIGAAAEFLRVFIAAPQQSRVRIRSLSSGTETTVDVAPGSLRMVQLDAGLNDYVPESAVLRGVIVTSDNPVHLFTGNYRDRHSDGTAVLPVNALGTRYVTAGYNWSDKHEHFTVLATEYGTAVTITPHAFTSTGRPDGQPFTVTLDQGEVYYVKAFVAGMGGSLTGTIVEATKPVAVFSGAESGWVPETTDPNFGYLNPLADQLIPVRFLGTEYVAVPFRSRRRGDTYRIVATEDNTTVTRSGGGMSTLPKAGDWTEDNLSDVTHISADKPVMVAHYANSALWDAVDNEYGDGSMLILAPVDRHMSCHYFPAGMLEADVNLLPNLAVSLEIGNWLQVRDTPQLASPVFTAECWMRPWDSGTIVSRIGGGGEFWRLDFDRGRRRMSFTYGTAAQSTVLQSLDNRVNPGVWTHVALAVDGNAGMLRLYIDGTLEIESAITPLNIPSSGGLAFGGVYNDVNAATYSGLLEECRFWATERSAAQIQAAMNGRLPVLDRTLLVGYWSFCESYTDETRFSHHFLPMGFTSLTPVYDLPAALNCVEQEDSNFVNIVVPDGGQSQVLLNFLPIDAGEFTSVAGTQWHTARLKVPTGINRLETSDPRGLGATTYGFAYHDAYTMCTGFRLTYSPAGSASPPAPASISLEAPSPQPMRGDATAVFTLPGSGDTQLALVDVLGRTRKVLASGSYAPGMHRIAFSTDGLAAGRYQLVLRALGQMRYRPVVILP